jgi:hypothetical protein
MVAPVEERRELLRLAAPGGSVFNLVLRYLISLPLAKFGPFSLVDFWISSPKPKMESDDDANQANDETQIGVQECIAKAKFMTRDNSPTPRNQNSEAWKYILRLQEDHPLASSEGRIHSPMQR